MNYWQVEKVYKALANRRRLAIIDYLAKSQKASVGDIADHINLSMTSTSKHLQILKNAGFVESRQIQLEQYYSLVNKNNSFIKQVLTTF